MANKAGNFTGENVFFLLTRLSSLSKAFSSNACLYVTLKSTSVVTVKIQIFLLSINCCLLSELLSSIKTL